MQVVHEGIRLLSEKPPPPSPPPPPPTPVARKGMTMSVEELRPLAVATMANTVKTLEELHNELRRMAHRVVDSDHREGCPGYEASVPDYHKLYSLTNITVTHEDDSSSSSASSSSF
jgi:hypothetical protein